MKLFYSVRVGPWVFVSADDTLNYFAVPGGKKVTREQLETWASSEGFSVKYCIV